MKRVLYLASSVALLASMVLVGNAFASHSSARQAKIKTVQLCTDTPYGVPADQQLSQGIRNGAALAIKAWAGKMKKAGVVVKQVNYDYVDPTNNSNYSATQAEKDGITCLGLSHSLGMDGTLNSGAALDEVKPLNEGHMVMISPANTSPALTSVKLVTGVGGGRVALEPCSPHGGGCSSGKIKWVTYYRTVTTDKLQGPAGAIFAHHKLKAKSFYLVDDGLPYGLGLAQFFKKEAKALGMKELGSSRIDTNNSGPSQLAIAGLIKAKNPNIVYCGCDSETSTALPRDLRAAGYRKPYMGGDALYNSSWLTADKGAGPGAVNNDVTSVGPDVSKAAKSFVQAYKKTFAGFYKNPGIQAYDATSYDAATAILMGIYDAAKADKLKGSIKSQRTAVVGYVSKAKFKGATGRTSFDKNGDTTNKIVSVYHTKTVNGTLTWVFNYQLTAKGSPT